MTYIPLARKWRPKTFSDLIGQDHVVHPLQNALQQDKLHHAYLFTGTRGVGKTTIARIFAKALNCQQGISAEPCLSCDNCLAIDEGRFFDLIEVDGASRTRVEDTRELIENIQYAPAQGRFKIFLIDEVHMLSTHSFNALLKTLEEPPEHVKFLLATTDPQKIPATILSRCLQFNLNPISHTMIESQVAFILEQEQFNFESNVLSLIASHANGSMRDAITLSEQLVSVFPNGLHYDSLAHFLGHSIESYSLQIMEAFLQHQPNRLIEISEVIARQQISHIRVIHFLLNHFHQCALLQIVPNKTSAAILQNCAKNFTSHQIHLIYQALEKACQEFDWNPSPNIGFQMLLLRIYHALGLLNHKQPNTPDYEPEPEQIPEPTEEPDFPAPEEPVPAEEPQTPSPADPDDNWSNIIEQLKIDGIGKTALSHSSLIERNEQLLLLEVETTYQSLFTPNILLRIENALSKYYQQAIKIKFQTPKAQTSHQTPAQIKKQQKQEHFSKLQQTVQSNEFVQKVISDCDAEIFENSMTFQTNEL